MPTRKVFPVVATCTASASRTEFAGVPLGCVAGPSEQPTDVATAPAARYPSHLDTDMSEPRRQRHAHRRAGRVSNRPTKIDLADLPANEWLEGKGSAIHAVLQTNCGSAGNDSRRGK